jgi:hypothetical protein
VVSRDELVGYIRDQGGFCFAHIAANALPPAVRMVLSAGPVCGQRCVHCLLEVSCLISDDICT